MCVCVCYCHSLLSYNNVVVNKMLMCFDIFVFVLFKSVGTRWGDQTVQVTMVHSLYSVSLSRQQYRTPRRSAPLVC